MNPLNFNKIQACALLLIGALVVGNASVSDARMGIDCPAKKQPALVHMFVGEYDMQGPKAFDKSTTMALSNEFNSVLRFVRRKAGMPVSAVSTAADADPASTLNSGGQFGGFILFTELDKRPATPVEGFELYWSSTPHVNFGAPFVQNLKLDDDGRGAASLQILTCVPEGGDSEPLGKYHGGLIVDLVPGNENCGDIVLSTLEALDTIEDTFAEESFFCGKQWADWKSLSFSDGLLGFDRNKANGAMDVGCVFNFNSRSVRDKFVAFTQTMTASLPAETAACVKESWIWAME